jgi:SCP-2 sterol transfer family
VTRVHVPGAPPAPRDRAAAAARALGRRKRGLQVALARFVARQPDRRLELLAGPVVVWAMPFVLRAGFRPEYAVDFDRTDIDGCILINLVGDRGGRRDQFEITLDRRRCRVRRRRPGGRRPDATLTVRLADLLRMLATVTDPPRLASEGRLAMTGDTFLLVRFPAMFGQPTRSVL